MVTLYGQAGGTIQASAAPINKAVSDMLAADVFASVLFTTLGYTVEEADQVVQEHIAPALATYLASHDPRLARVHGHKPTS